MDFIGLLRSIHPTLQVVGGIFVLVTVLLVAVLAIIRNVQDVDEDDRKKFRKGTWISYFIVLAVLFVIVIGRMIQVSSTDRIPRNAVDRSGLYQ
jgi:cytochrome bd-type quinol oxidase subunit 2